MDKILKSFRKNFVDIITGRFSSFIITGFALILGWLFGAAGDFVSIPDRVIALEGDNEVIVVKVDKISENVDMINGNVDNNTLTLEEVKKEQEETHQTVKDIYNFLIAN